MLLIRWFLKALSVLVVKTNSTENTTIMQQDISYIAGPKWEKVLLSENSFKYFFVLVSFNNIKQVKKQKGKNCCLNFNIPKIF